MDKVDIWASVSLSDPSTIKALLRFMSEFYVPTMDEDTEGRYGLASNVDLNEMSEDVIVTYLDLINLIENTKFTGRQGVILDYLIKGFTDKDISKEIGVARQTVAETINVICNKIVATGNEIWLNDFVLWDKIRVKTDYKQCSKCREWLPKTEKYYRKRKDSVDGFRASCRKCQ